MFTSLALTNHDVKRYTPRLQFQLPCEIRDQKYSMTNFGQKKILKTKKLKSRKVRNACCARLTSKKCMRI